MKSCGIDVFWRVRKTLLRRTSGALVLEWGGGPLACHCCFQADRLTVNLFGDILYQILTVFVEVKIKHSLLRWQVHVGGLQWWDGMFPVSSCIVLWPSVKPSLEVALVTIYAQCSWGEDKISKVPLCGTEQWSLLHPTCDFSIDG